MVYGMERGTVRGDFSSWTWNGVTGEKGTWGGVWVSGAGREGKDIVAENENQNETGENSNYNG